MVIVHNNSDPKVSALLPTLRIALAWIGVQLGRDMAYITMWQAMDHGFKITKVK